MNFRKLISLILVVTAMLSCVTPVIAVQSKANDDQYPQLLVTGFGSGCVKIYYENDPEKKSLFWPFESERFIKNLGNVGEYALSAVENKNPDILHNIIYGYVMDCFGMLALTPDGDNMAGVTTESVGARKVSEGKYEFYYDCRQSPVDIAHHLNDAIDQVLAETGKKKVELVGSSYGANVVTAFMYLYDEELDKIDTVLQCVPSVGGIRFLGELFSGNFEISAIGLCDFIDRMIDLDLIPNLFYFMEKAGVLEVFLDALVVPVLREAVYEAIVDVARDFIATLPAMWACIPDEYFTDAMKFIYGENYNDPNHTYAKLISNMTYFHKEIANKAADIYIKAEENHKGLNMALITKFGIAAIPFGSGENIMDDGLVSVPVSSFGATCANYGERLPDDYVQARYPEYNFMCPEFNIDASTGIFPFKTWYIKGLEHTQKNEDYNILIDKIVYNNIDITSDPECPQFQQVSPDDAERLIPLIAEEEEENSFLINLLIQ